MNVLPLAIRFLSRCCHLAGLPRATVLGLILLVSLVPVAFAQIIPTNRLVNWSGAGCPIPSANWPIFTNAMSAGAKGNGVADDSQVLSSIIASCPPGQVVYLPAGNYVVSTNFTISKGIVIRGAGMTNTIITPTTNALNPIFAFQPAATRSSGAQQFAPLYGGYSKGSTNLILSAPVANPSSVGFVVGNDILIDQLDDGVFVNPQGSEGYCGYCSLSNGTRALNQSARITSINGTNIGIDAPLYWYLDTNYLSQLPPFGNYTNSLHPEISWYNGSNLYNAGLESLCINDFYASNSAGSYNAVITFFWCDNCWVSNVETEYGGLAHEVFFNCYHCTLRDSYLLNGKAYASQNYGVEICNGSSACLVEDNMMINMGAACLIGWGASGNVFSYNYIPQVLWYAPYWQGESIAVHDCHAMFNLIEGNITPSIDFDSIHGSSSHMTVFRNQSYGWQSNLCENCIALISMASSTYNNIVGNVLGTTTSNMLNQAIPPTPFFLLATNAADTMDSAIYCFGYYGVDYSTTGYDFNPLNTAIINGNYDFYHQSTTWISNNVVALPASLYLSGQPSWWTNWGVTRWPAIGPDVTGLTNMIPAELRFLEMSGASAPHSVSPPASLPAPTDLHMVATGTTTNGSTPVSYDQYTAASAVAWPFAGSINAFATPFTASSNYTGNTIELYLASVGSPTGIMAAQIWTGTFSSGPTALLGTACTALSQSSVPTTETVVTFTGGSFTLVGGSSYWVVLIGTYVDSSDYIEWSGGPYIGNNYTWASQNGGASWAATGNNELKFVLLSQ
jgi:hypothetical protein